MFGDTGVRLLVLDSKVHATGNRYLSMVFIVYAYTHKRHGSPASSGAFLAPEQELCHYIAAEYPNTQTSSLGKPVTIKATTAHPPPSISQCLQLLAVAS